MSVTILAQFNFVAAVLLVLFPGLPSSCFRAMVLSGGPSGRALRSPAPSVTDSTHAVDMGVTCTIIREVVSAGASRQVAAAVASALWRLQVAGLSACSEDDTVVANNVRDRLDAIAPAFRAQECEAGSTGRSPHSAKNLVPPGVHLRANAARHVGFGSDFSSMDDKTIRKLQRGFTAGKTAQRKDDDEVFHQYGTEKKVDEQQNILVKVAKLETMITSIAGAVESLQADIEKLNSAAAPSCGLPVEKNEAKLEASNKGLASNIGSASSHTRHPALRTALLEVISDQPSMEGLHLGKILKIMGYTAPASDSQIVDTLAELVGASDLYTTITEQHYAAT